MPSPNSLKNAIVLVSLCGLRQIACAQNVFGSLDDLLRYASAKSITLQSGSIRLAQAKKARLAAVLAVPDVQASAAFNLTDNTRLPVNLFPAEVLGGQAGTYVQVKTGVQYNTAATQTADIKLLNWSGWANLKLAVINIAVVETDIALTRKSLYESIASMYYAILQLQDQEVLTQQNALAADTLLQLATAKYREGLVRQQDVNDSRVNALSIRENARQIHFQIRQQYLALKILCDLPDSSDLRIAEPLTLEATQQAAFPNRLSIKSYQLKEAFAQASLRKAERDFLPTLSFVANNGFSQYNQDFTIAGGSWIQSQYVGLRLAFNLPNAATIGSRVNARYNYELAQQAARQARIKSALDSQSLDNDRDKAASQASSYDAVLRMQQDTYDKNKSLYAEGLLGLDRILNSFAVLVNTGYNLATAKAALRLASAKIDINNRIR